MFRNMQNAEIIRKMTEEFDEVTVLFSQRVISAVFISKANVLPFCRSCVHSVSSSQLLVVAGIILHTVMKLQMNLNIKRF